VAPRAFLERWISGAEISTLATEFLSEVESRELAVEQVVDAISEQCEHYLSWMLGVVSTIVNDDLAAGEPRVEIGELSFRGVAGQAERRLCENLPLYVRYGVDSAEAVELISSGLRSRTFAHRVASVAQAHELESGGLREWLQGLPIDRWRALFGGTPADLLDLLEYTRARGRGLLGALLADGQADVEAELEDSIADGLASVRLIDTDRPPQRFGIFRETELLGVLSAAAHADVAAVIDSGLEFQARVADGTLTLLLPETSADAT
jgi:hypothetical protein